MFNVETPFPETQPYLVLPCVKASQATLDSELQETSKEHLKKNHKMRKLQDFDSRVSLLGQIREQINDWNMNLRGS